MGEKSYVSLSASVCPICGREFENGELILDRRLKNSLERVTVVDARLCPDHQKLADDGYIALVAIDESKSKFEANGNLKPECAYRTGDIIHIRRTVADKMFNVPISDREFVYCDLGIVEHMKRLADEAQD
jgi:hypothetical protein